MRAFFTGLLAVLLLLPPRPRCFSQASLPVPSSHQTQLVANLNRVIRQLMRDGDVPGLAVVLIRDGRIAWRQNYGVMSVDTRRPVGDDTIFEAASLTKPVFAYAVLKL